VDDDDDDLDWFCLEALRMLLLVEMHEENCQRIHSVLGWITATCSTSA